MESYPLQSISLDEAIEKQFKLIEIICKNINGRDILNLGDLGVEKTNNMPLRTRSVEKIIAEFFGGEDSFLVRGSGTNALRLSFIELLKNENQILVHDAPIYKTSEFNLKSMKVNKEVINEIMSIDSTIKIIVDDNYAVCKTKENGVEMGADITAFSTFKLLGPVGIGVIVGNKNLISNMKKNNYSGGSQVQGFEAMEVLRGLVYAPVSLSIQAREIEKLKKILSNDLRFPYIKNVYIANAQSKVILVEFKESIAKKILEKTVDFGALTHPVGAESKFEFSPLIYRVSGTFLDSDPTLAERMIRINPNRSGAENIANIIEKAYYWKRDDE